MKRRIMALCLLLVFLVMIFPFGAQSAEYENTVEMEYEVDVKHPAAEVDGGWDIAEEEFETWTIVKAVLHKDGELATTQGPAGEIIYRENSHKTEDFTEEYYGTRSEKITDKFTIYEPGEYQVKYIYVDNQGNKRPAEISSVFEVTVAGYGHIDELKSPDTIGSDVSTSLEVPSEYTSGAIDSPDTVYAEGEEPNFITRMLIGTLQVLLDDIRFVLGLQSLDNLVYGGSTSAFVETDEDSVTRTFFPAGWTEHIENAFSIMASVATLGYFLVLINLLLKFSVSGSNPGMRLTVQKDITTMFGSFALLVIFLPLASLLIGLIQDFTLMFWDSNVSVYLQGLAPDESLLGGIVVSFALFGMELYLNFVYAVIWLSTAFLIIFAPLFILGLNFDNTRKSFEVFVRELASNLLTPALHAVILFVFAGIMAQMSLFFKLVAFMAIMPITDMFKSCLVGNSSSGQMASRLGGAALMSVVGISAIAKGSGKRGEAKGGSGGSDVFGREGQSPEEDTNVQKMLNRPSSAETERKTQGQTAQTGSPVVGGSSDRSLAKDNPLSAERKVRRKAKSAGLSAARLGTAAGGALIGGATLAPLGPQGFKAGMFGGGALGYAAGSYGTGFASEPSDAEAIRRDTGIKETSYGPDGSMDVAYDAGFVKKEYGIDSVTQGDDGPVYEIDMNNCHSAQKSHLERLNKNYQDYKNGTIPPEDFKKDYGMIKSMSYDKGSGIMKVAYNEDELKKQGIEGAYMKDDKTFVERYSKGTLPQTKKQRNLDTAPRWGIGR